MVSGNLLNLIKHYLKISKSSSKWSVFKLATSTCGSSSRIHFRTFVFLMYINDLPDGLKSKVKLFADDTSLYYFLFSVKKKEESASDLINDLDTISKWAYNLKMSVNPDPNKPLKEVLFSRKNSNNSSNYLFQQCSGAKSYSTKAFRHHFCWKVKF